MVEYKSPLVTSIADIASEVLFALDMYSGDALNLIMRTGAAESGFLRLEQMGKGPALGFFQMEPNTAADTWFNYLVYREDLRKSLLAITGIKSGPYSDLQIKSNIALQVALCRFKYRRDTQPIPSAIMPQAHYWKSVYNTIKGKGTVDHFVAAVKGIEV